MYKYGRKLSREPEPSLNEDNYRKNAPVHCGQEWPDGYCEECGYDFKEDRIIPKNWDTYGT